MLIGACNYALRGRRVIALSTLARETAVDLLYIIHVRNVKYVM